MSISFTDMRFFKKNGHIRTLDGLFFNRLCLTRPDIHKYEIRIFVCITNVCTAIFQILEMIKYKAYCPTVHYVFCPVFRIIAIYTWYLNSFLGEKCLATSVVWGNLGTKKYMATT